MSNNNLSKSKPASEDRSYDVPTGPKTKLSHIAHALYKTLPTHEVDEVLKCYRRSDASAPALIADFMRCDVPRPPFVVDDVFKESWSEVIERFDPPMKYRPVHYCDTRAFPWTLNSSVEAPYSTDPAVSRWLEEEILLGKLPERTGRQKTFHNLMNYVYIRNRNLIHEIKEGRGLGDRFFAWNTAHARSHLVGVEDPDKIRMVHGVPKLFLQAEVMLLWPYLNYLSKWNTPLAWDMSMADGGMMKLSNEFFQGDNFNVFIAVDWKQFDKLVSFDMIDYVHNHWRSYLDLSRGYMPSADYPETSVTPYRIENLFRWMNQAAKHTPVRLPDGSEWKRSHSTLSSGMLQTQVLDSFINAAMTVTCLKDIGFHTQNMKYRILGDDGIVAAHLPSNLSIEDVLPRMATSALKRFGAIVNTEKSACQSELTGLTFLGYSFKNGYPVRSTSKLLAQLAFPERYTSLEDMLARSVGIAMASCGQDSKVWKVCKDVFEYCSRHAKGPANPRGFQFANYLETLEPRDWDTFPTMFSLQSRCSKIPVRNPAVARRMWPEPYFLAQY